MDRVTAGRTFVGDTLGFHLLLVIFGVGLPLIISALELYGILSHRPRAIKLARIWSQALAVLFIAGAVSGTIVSLQFDLFWPKFMTFIGKTVGVAFALEGAAFMVEAVFLGVYMLSWKRFKPLTHWLVGIPIVLGSLTSAVFITMANAFMNHPTGFKLNTSGQPIDIHITQELFTRTSFTEVTHSIAAYICVTALSLLAVYAWLQLKPTHRTDRPWMLRVMAGLAIVALVFGLLVGALGDQAGRYLASSEPYKLAAAEGLAHSKAHAPLIIGGVVTSSGIEGGISIPSGLSILATHSPSGVVQGIDATPQPQRPPGYIHYFFDGMALIGTIIVLLPMLFLILYKWRKAWSVNHLMLWGLIVSAILGGIATEFGWLVTEFGRQPYIIYGVMRTRDALTTSQIVIRLGSIFPILYVILLGATIWVLRKTISHKDLHK